MKKYFGIESIVIDSSISIHDQALKVDEKKILLPDVTGIKYGYAPIEFDMYTIGSRYMVEMKTRNDKIKLNFRSYFGISRKQQFEKFSALIDALSQSTIVRLVNEMIDEIERGGAVMIDQYQISENGISYKNFTIAWNDLSYQKNYNRLTINSKSNPDVYSNLYFTETYNVHVLMHFLDWKFQNT